MQVAGRVAKCRKRPAANHYSAALRI
jgi:hypothetical protein